MIKVIVVDDERFVRMGIVGETDWGSLGCEVVGEAENGLDALELVHEKNPDLMICDIRMPKMNGLEMLKKLREEKNPVQVIFLTAYSEFSYAREALKLYAFDYLLKPFEDGELESAILRAKERIENAENQKHIRVTADALRIEPIIVAPALAVPMLLVMLVVMLAVPHLRKRKNQREENHHEEHP